MDIKYCKPRKFNKRLHLMDLMNCLESLKIVAVNLPAYCMHCADPISKNSGRLTVQAWQFVKYICCTTFQVYSNTANVDGCTFEFVSVSITNQTDADNLDESVCKTERCLHV